MYTMHYVCMYTANQLNKVLNFGRIYVLNRLKGIEKFCIFKGLIPNTNLIKF